MSAHRYVAAAVAAAAALCCAAPAQAVWSGAGSGQAAARAMTMPAGNQPAVSVSGTDVAVRWSAALLPGGTPVAGYLILRIGVNGQAVAAAASCAGTITTTTCVEHNVPAGTWTYTDTPVQLSWTGTPSAPSAAAVVG